MRVSMIKYSAYLEQTFAASCNRNRPHLAHALKYIFCIYMRNSSHNNEEKVLKKI